jgi:carnitine-CoA ligase
MNNEIVEAAWKSRLLGARIEYWAQRQPDKLMIQCGEDALSWSDVERMSRQLAGSLQTAGVNQGDTVAVISTNRIEMVLSLFALARMGAIAVPLNVYLRGEFLRFQLADAGARVVIADQAGIASVRALPAAPDDLALLVALEEEPDQPGPQSPHLVRYTDLLCGTASFVAPDISIEDPVALLYTSGTTGMPKGCIYSHGYYMATSIACIESDWMRPDDIIFCPFPLFHTAGYSIFLGGTIQCGASMCLDQTFSASEFVHRVIHAGATVAHGVGPMGMAILATPESPADRQHRLRLCTWPPMSPEHQLRFEARFGVSVISGGYGQTECVPITTLSAAEARLHRTSLGHASPYMEVQVVDDHDNPVAPGVIGEIVTRPRRANAMFSGYWQRPEASVALWRNLWHHTGDLGRSDDAGFFYFVDRKKDAMRRRGENVSSYELEQAMLKHPAIAAVAAHAVPSPLAEDDIKVCIVPAGGTPPTPGELHDFFKANLPYFAIPRYVQFFDALPTNANGRVMKHKLRELGVADAIDLEALGYRVERDDRRG